MKTPALWIFLLGLPSTALSGEPSVVIDDFERGLRPGWEIKEFRGATEYSVVDEGGNHVLRAVSRGTATGLVYPIVFDPRELPILTWRWKVERLIEKSDPTRKEGDDYSARVYVVFPHWFPPKTKSLNYIWATRFRKEGFIPNPFFRNAVMIAVESGPEHVGKWVTERRDIVADYRQAFEEDPPKAGAIAVMTDTDQTGEGAIAYYDDIRIEER